MLIWPACVGQETQSHSELQQTMKNSGSQVCLPLHLPWEAGLADGNPFLKVVVFSCLLTCELPLPFPSRGWSPSGLLFLHLPVTHGNFSSLLTVGLGKLEQPEISVSRTTDESVQISCKASINSFKSVAIHWYRQKPNQGLEFLLYVIATPTHILLDEKHKKMEASKNSSASTSTLTIYSLEEDDEAIYYCSYG